VAVHLTPYHDGELALQSAVGATGEAARLGRTIATEIAPRAAEFIGRQQIAIVASLDPNTGVVCSALVGDPGAFEVIDPSTLRLDISAGIVADELAWRADVGASLGALFIDVTTRRRYRVNGTVLAVDGSRLVVRVVEAYPNCPKYIQRRTLGFRPTDGDATGVAEGVALSAEERALVAAADTFFIASAGPDRRLDASHRGGRPGFVRTDGDRLWVPDYAGNNMFNTLGNLALDPRAGLLFIDFRTGETLQLGGVVELDLATADAATGGTNRSWTFTTTSWRRSRLALRPESTLVELSPVNP
jgi:predicted pyridoxine 5'-phosphate oxidase superfamily flavin-nucleotide-binding protein